MYNVSDDFIEACRDGRRLIGVFVFWYGNTYCFDIYKYELQKAIIQKNLKRKSFIYIKEALLYLNNIANSKSLIKMWQAYRSTYFYAADIKILGIVDCIKGILIKGDNKTGMF